MSNAPDSNEAVGPGRPDAVIPRYHLPDDWSGKGACPVCRVPGQLRVRHQEGAPDQMVCGSCNTAFEVETGGTRIRLAVAPASLTKSAGLLDTWLTPHQLRALLAEPASPIEQPTAFAPAAAVDFPATAQAEPNPAQPSPAKMAAEPPPPKPANGAADLEPGTEDWFASLAAAIGGLSPVVPPPDDVLADELERALMARPAAGSNGAARAVLDAAADAAPSGAASAAARAVTALSDNLPDTAVPATPGPAPATSEVASNGAPDALASNPAAPAGPEATATLVVESNIAQPAAAAAAAPEVPVSPDNARTIVGPTIVAPISNSQSPTMALAAAPAATAGATPVTLVPGASPSRLELAERAWKLHELGNSLASIQGALESSGGTAEDVTVIMGKLIALEQARQARFRRNTQIMLGGALAVLLVLLVIGALITLSPAPAAPPNPTVTSAGSAAPATIAAQAGTPGPGETAAAGTPAGSPTAALSYNPIIGLLNQLLPGDVKLANGPSPTPMPTSALLSGLFPATATYSEAELATADAKKSSLPAWVGTLVPSSMIVVTAPAPSLDLNGPGASPCPTTALQASALFGGSAANWTFYRQQGWIFILPGNSIAIRVPANMTAGYLVIGQNPEIRSVVGPATIHGLNFVSISCS